MGYRALVMTDGDPPAVTLRDSLLPDHAIAEVGGVTVLTGPAPWRAHHDLLVNPEDRTLCGIVYAVPTAERAAILRRCNHAPPRIVRYCVSPRMAASLLDDGTPLVDMRRAWGDPAAGVKAFPASLRPFRQLLRDCLSGTRDPSELPPGPRAEAAEFFRSLGEEDYVDEWPGGDVDRVEVVWARPAAMANLPPWFPSMLHVETAQQFAEDIWLYRQEDGGVVGVGLNHLDEIVAGFGLTLPEGCAGRSGRRAVP